MLSVCLKSLTNALHSVRHLVLPLCQLIRNGLLYQHHVLQYEVGHSLYLHRLDNELYLTSMSGPTVKCSELSEHSFF